MGQVVKLTDIPASEVDAVVQLNTDAGATVVKTLQPDGNYTVVATYPNGNGNGGN